jgi:ATP-dependent Lon protease
MHIASYYTREAGVRSLERSIGSVARWKAVEWTERTYDTSKANNSLDVHVNEKTTTTDQADISAALNPIDVSNSMNSLNTSNATDSKLEIREPYNPIVDVQHLESILGIPRWDPSEKEREERRGLVYGLVVSGYGEGGVLPVESVITSGTGQLRLTGSLGDVSALLSFPFSPCRYGPCTKSRSLLQVIRESGEIALSWVKAHAYQLGITSSPSQDPLKDYYSNDSATEDNRKVKKPNNSGDSSNSGNSRNAINIHLHLPSGAIKKDGPSAGVAYVCAFVSLLTGLTVPSDVAMTGETTLRGRVTAVGGIKEKVCLNV